MSTIRRSPTNVTGNLTVNQGDVIVTESGKGLVLPDPVDVPKRVTIGVDAGQDVLEIEDV